MRRAALYHHLQNTTIHRRGPDEQPRGRRRNQQREEQKEAVLETGRSTDHHMPEIAHAIKDCWRQRLCKTISFHLICLDVSDFQLARLLC